MKLKVTGEYFSTGKWKKAFCTNHSLSQRYSDQVSPRSKKKNYYYSALPDLAKSEEHS